MLENINSSQRAGRDLSGRGSLGGIWSRWSDFVTNRRDLLFEGRKVGARDMLQDHHAGRDRYTHVLNAVDTARRGLDLGCLGGTIHALDPVEVAC